MQGRDENVRELLRDVLRPRLCVVVLAIPRDLAHWVRDEGPLALIDVGAAATRCETTAITLPDLIEQSHPVTGAISVFQLELQFHNFSNEQIGVGLEADAGLANVSAHALCRPR